MKHNRKIYRNVSIGEGSALGEFIVVSGSLPRAKMMATCQPRSARAR